MTPGDRRVTVDLTMRVGFALADEEVAVLVEGAMRALREDGQPIRSPRVRRVAGES